MKPNLCEYCKMMDEHDIQAVYSGPLWANGVDNMAEMLIKRLELDEIPFHASQAVFSVFIEQVSNMMLYSAQRETKADAQGNPQKVTKGIVVMGARGTEYFIQTGNLVTNRNAEILKTRIDYLNRLDKKQLRAYHKEQLMEENENEESRGAGLGLIIVARRATAPIAYEFKPHDEGHQYFSMYITIEQGATQ